MLTYLLYRLFVIQSPCCSDDCAKTAFLFYVLPLYIGFFSYVSVMCTQLSKGEGLLPFFILLFFTLEAFISCLFIKPFIKDVPYRGEPLLNL